MQRGFDFMKQYPQILERLRQQWQTHSLRVAALIQTERFALFYALAAVGILLATTVYWSTLGSIVQLSNADALVDAYLFKDSATFHGATFPGQHTFLLKWPLFFLIRLLGFTSFSFVAVTVLAVLLTIGALIFVLYKIDRRPLVFGTICLALASVLLLVPAQPYPGGLLPVNMAMLTTRNLEYVVYIAALILLTRVTKVRSYKFWLATVFLAVLFASDKLFLTIGIGGALVALVGYAFIGRWEMVRLVSRWLVAQILATVGTYTVFAIMTASHLTHILGASGVGPYSAATDIHNLVLGSLYGGLNVMTNLGANPAFDAIPLKSLLPTAFRRIFSFAGVPFIVNALLALGSFGAAAWVLWHSTQRKSMAESRRSVPVADGLSVMLIWSSLVALSAFIVSSHYYVVDARYLTVILFTCAIAGTAFTRKREWRPTHLVGVGCVLVIAIGLGLVISAQVNSSERAALRDIDERNESVLAAARNHPTDVLVGDYWRVLPIRFKASSNLAILPLAGCSEPRVDLSSTVWQQDLRAHSFSYLLSYDQSLTGRAACSLQDIITAYGRPNSSALIAGTPDHPEEQLLFYDHGALASAPLLQVQGAVPSTVLPVVIDELPNVSCPAFSIMPIVAHQDDDLLFMNPDILHAINSGTCVRTVYLTAGDAGWGQFYWLKRQQGSEVAYSKMLGANVLWVERIVKLADNEFATIANPRGNAKISLIFLHLPDGNLLGQGFHAYHGESLAKLYNHQITSIHSVDGQSTYTADQLVSALNTLMYIYSPSEIYTQSTFHGTKYPDHSDHITAGQFAKLAYNRFETMEYNNLVAIPFRPYMGYPIHERPSNVSGVDLQAKEAAFLAYAQYDGGVCNSERDCARTATYEAYLTHQYQAP